jgi:hypothetical protein
MRDRVRKGVLTQTLKPVIVGGSVLAGLKNRFPGLKASRSIQSVHPYED